MIAIGRLQDTLLALKEEAMHLTWTSVSSAGVARGRVLLNLLPPRRDQGGLGGEQGGRSSDGQEGVIRWCRGSREDGVSHAKGLDCAQWSEME